MTRDSAENREICPFWSTRAMKCQLCREGLFLPLNDHIEVYCTTLNYDQCLQYLLYSANDTQAIEKNNRRKYERLKTCHMVTLVKLVRTGQPASHVPPTTGITMDLGKGGMRLTTDQPLAKATLIRFSFDESFPASVQIGEGQIAWCNKQSDEPVYQAGIAFQGARLIDTMGLYLGLIASIPPSAG